MLTAKDIDCAMGKALRLRRHKAHLTQDALGSASGVKFQQIQKYETGANRVSISRLFALSDALGIDPVTLISDVQEITGHKAPASGSGELEYLEVLADRNIRKLARNMKDLDNPQVSAALVRLVSALSSDTEMGDEIEAQTRNTA